MWVSNNISFLTNCPIGHIVGANDIMSPFIVLQLEASKESERQGHWYRIIRLMPIAKINKFFHFTNIHTNHFPMCQCGRHSLVVHQTISLFFLGTASLLPLSSTAAGCSHVTEFWPLGCRQQWCMLQTIPHGILHLPLSSSNLMQSI